MSTSPLTTLKRYRTRFTATMAAVAVLSGGVVALTAGTASALPVCVTLREWRGEDVQAASYSFGSTRRPCSKKTTTPRTSGSATTSGTCSRCRTTRGSSIKRGANGLSDWLVTR